MLGRVQVGASLNCEIVGRRQQKGKQDSASLVGKVRSSVLGYRLGIIKIR